MFWVFGFFGLFVSVSMTFRAVGLVRCQTTDWSVNQGSKLAAEPLDCEQENKIVAELLMWVLWKFPTGVKRNPRFSGTLCGFEFLGLYLESNSSKTN